MAWEVTPKAAFVMGYLYANALKQDCPIHITKREFNGGACAVWAGVRNKPDMVGTWWPLADVEKEDLDACAQTCARYLMEGEYPLKARVYVRVLDHEVLF